MTITVRVYGILINSKNQILVSDEYIRGEYYTKFPGGGMEVGEGTRDCLVREFKEELNIDITTGNHIYTTDYFQPSAFNTAHQILSIYYFVHTNEENKIECSVLPFQFNKTALEKYANIRQAEAVRWIDLKNFSQQSVSLPIDKIVAERIKCGNVRSVRNEMI